MKLKLTRYKTIVIDPPWPHIGGGRRGSNHHYKVLKMDDIVPTILNSGRWHPDESGCHCYLWVINNYLMEGYAVLKELGFRYINNVVWVKDRYGIGHYFRGQHEICLFGVVGKLPTLANDLPSIVHAKRGKHSAKPQEFFDLVERASPGPRLEMFARKQRSGWTVWGDEC
jgi:N6-adenosine-specific RNA methylase IME4